MARGSFQRSPAAREVAAPPDHAGHHHVAAPESVSSVAAASAGPAPVPSLTPQQLKHLDYIQDTVGRHITHAFAVKGWSLTVTAAIFAYAAGHMDPWIALVALLPPLAFSWLDLYYLRQALLYEEMYRGVIRFDPAVFPLDMDSTRYHDVQAHPRCSYRHCMTMSSWWVLHLTTITVGLVLLGVAILK